MKNLLFLLVYIFMITACSNENEHLIDENSMSEDSILDSLSLRTTYQNIEDDPYPDIGTAPAPTEMDIMEGNFEWPLELTIYPNVGGYAHIQYRRALASGYGYGEWYNYHPQRIEFDTLHVDTARRNDSNRYTYYLNIKALPADYVTFRVRTIRDPREATGNNVSKWSTIENLIDNRRWGYESQPSPSDPDVISVNVTMDVDIFSHIPDKYYYVVSITNPANGSSTRSVFSELIRVDQPTNVSCTVTVKIYEGMTLRSTLSNKIERLLYVGHLFDPDFDPDRLPEYITDFYFFTSRTLRYREYGSVFYLE